MSKEKKRRSSIDVAKLIFNALINEEINVDKHGIGIKDCRGKEIMIITRYGGDVLFTFFDVGGNIKFISVFEMKRPYITNWAKILNLFVQIKRKLKQ